MWKGTYFSIRRMLFSIDYCNREHYTDFKPLTLKQTTQNTIQRMIGHSKNLTTEINRQYNYRKRPHTTHNENFY
jgi:hypothetical protein